MLLVLYYYYHNSDNRKEKKDISFSIYTQVDNIYSILIYKSYGWSINAILLAWGKSLNPGHDFSVGIPNNLKI